MYSACAVIDTPSYAFLRWPTRLDETNVISIAFVHNASIPMLAVLYQVRLSLRHR